MTSKKNPSNVHVYSRFSAIPFAVRDLNFHLIIVVNLNDDSMAILIQAETT